MPNVTQILSQIESGDPLAAEQLVPLDDDELHNLAAAKLAHEKSREMSPTVFLKFFPMCQEVRLHFQLDDLDGVKRSPKMTWHE